MADYRRQIGFIKKWEGGMSRNPNDSASSFPMPCLYAGSYGWHTNKGVTWRSFFSNANALGYLASCENFIAMPDAIWLKIFKQKYWDAFDLDGYRSQAIADIIVAWAWGSGNGGAYRQLAKFLNANYASNFSERMSDYNSQSVQKIKELFNAITKKNKREAIVHEELIEHFRNFYYSLNQPYYIKGWLNRLEDLNEFTSESLSEKRVNWGKVLLIGSGVVLLSLGVYTAIELSRTQKI